jgi:predicted AlkP superfamily pyrophosphatase or phosphodiesterase
VTRSPAKPPKLVLTVIDGLKPSMLERAIETGRAPALQAIVERGTYVDRCCAAFPSVTPVCAATIATGVRQDEHHIPAMNWYHREEDRYVEYGSSFGAARRFGVVQQLTDTVYNMNLEHLPAEVLTVFETLDDQDKRTAGTTYLIYRGRHRHEVSRSTALTRLASTVVRRHVMGPRELFYADLFASRETPCRAQLGLPGIRDQHSGCVGAYLVEHDLFDFLLFSLPDNDTHSHGNGPHARRRGRRLPRRARGDRRGRPLACGDRAAQRPLRRVRGLARAGAERLGARRGRDRALPVAARRHGLRAAARGARCARAADRRDGPGPRGRGPGDVAPGAT